MIYSQGQWFYFECVFLSSYYLFFILFPRKKKSFQLAVIFANLMFLLMLRIHCQSKHIPLVFFVVVSPISVKKISNPKGLWPDRELNPVPNVEDAHCLTFGYGGRKTKYPKFLSTFSSKLMRHFGNRLKAWAVKPSIPLAHFWKTLQLFFFLDRFSRSYNLY